MGVRIRSIGLPGPSALLYVLDVPLGEAPDLVEMLDRPAEPVGPVLIDHPLGQIVEAGFDGVEDLTPAVDQGDELLSPVGATRTDPFR